MQINGVYGRALASLVKHVYTRTQPASLCNNFVIEISLHVPMYMYLGSIDTKLLAASKSTIALLYQACIRLTVCNSCLKHLLAFWQFSYPALLFWALYWTITFTIFLTVLYILGYPCLSCTLPSVL